MFQTTNQYFLMHPEYCGTVDRMKVWRYPQSAGELHRILTAPRGRIEFLKHQIGTPRKKNPFANTIKCTVYQMYIKICIHKYMYIYIYLYIYIHYDIDIKY